MPLYESYTTGDDSGYVARNSGTPIWIAQTFTPSTAHKITSVKLYMLRFGLPGTLIVSIKATDGSGHPTGNDLCSGTTDGDTLPPTSDTPEWREITLGAGCGLSATKYAIVVKAFDSDAFNHAIWRSDDSSPTYAGGNNERSTDEGDTWTAYTGSDFLFQEFGDEVVAPTVTTDAASSIGGTTATENGTLDTDGGIACDCGFEYGLTTSYGDTTPTQSKTTGQTFLQDVTGLLPATLYHFRAIATNAAGTAYGSDLTFTTTGSTSPTEAHTRVTGLVHRWSAGPNPVYQLEIMQGGLFSQYFSPIGIKEPEPTIPMPREAPVYIPTLIDYGNWLAARTPVQQAAIFGEGTIEFNEWQRWAMNEISKGRGIS